MEQHPVPQNVTTFQFRLIGEMTIKQFAYVAVGVMVAFIFYKLPFPNIITWPLAGFSCLFGFGLAFVPIEERPMDVWVLSFLRSIYSPTLYVWQKEEKTGEQTMQQQSAPPIPLAPIVTTTPQATTIQTPEPPHSKLSIPSRTMPTPDTQPLTQPRITHTSSKGGGFFSWFTHLFASGAPKSTITHQSQSQHAPVTPTPPNVSFVPIPSITPSITGKHIDAPTEPEPKEKIPEKSPEQEAKITAIEEHNKELAAQLEKLKADLVQRTSTDDRLVEVQTQLTKLLSERQHMEDEIRSLKSKLTHAQSVAESPVHTATTVIPETPEKPTVKVITQETAVKAGLPRLTTTPNVITGICKDADGNLLPGVLVTVRDKEGIPLRALKTNKLGQFAASTPLPDATYYVEVEDPRSRFTFDRIQITLNGSLLPAVEIKARSEKEITRQKIAQDLFGTKGM